MSNPSAAPTPGPLDPLTALLSPRGLAEAMPAREGLPAWAFTLDIHQFRDINHAVGRAAGDRILAVCANAIRRSVRAGDLVARVGGDHFAVVLAIAHEVDARRVAFRVRRAVTAALSPMPELAAHGGRLSFNVGLCEFGWADPIAVDRIAQLTTIARLSNPRRGLA